MSRLSRAKARSKLNLTRSGFGPRCVMTKNKNPPTQPLTKKNQSATTEIQYLECCVS